MARLYPVMHEDISDKKLTYRGYGICLNGLVMVATTLPPPNGRPDFSCHSADRSRFEG